MVEQVLTTQRDAVRQLLAANRHLVAALRDALVERHELIGTEITDILEAAAAAGPAEADRPVAARLFGGAVVGPVPGKDSDRVIDLRDESVASTDPGIR
jgi:hypothetical protein